MPEEFQTLDSKHAALERKEPFSAINFFATGDRSPICTEARVGARGLELYKLGGTCVAGPKAAGAAEQAAEQMLRPPVLRIGIQAFLMETAFTRALRRLL